MNQFGQGRAILPFLGRAEFAVISAGFGLSRTDIEFRRYVPRRTSVHDMNFKSPMFLDRQDDLRGNPGKIKNQIIRPALNDIGLIVKPRPVFLQPGKGR